MNVEELWYGQHPLSLVLAPLGWVSAGYALLRRQAYQSGLLRVRHLPVPVIVVGNVTVGGTGKTPLVIWLAEFLKAQGYKPGIVSRGYGGDAEHWPQQVRPDSDPVTVGDEPVLIAQRCLCPVAVSPKRAEAAEALVEHAGCDIVVSDDGLQHLALGRDIEIAVVDGVRRYGNGRCLPAGPLREPVRRLGSVDIVVSNGLASRGEFAMKYLPLPLRGLRDESVTCSLDDLHGEEVHAVAGVGNPERFFQTLRAHGLRLQRHPFPDHYAFKADDIRFGDGVPVIMTEKDAVKCRRFAGPEHWYLPIEADFSQTFEHRLLSLLKRTRDGQKAA